jgi:hypothetical protein
VCVVILCKIFCPNVENKIRATLTLSRFRNNGIKSKEWVSHLISFPLTALYSVSDLGLLDIATIPTAESGRARPIYYGRRAVWWKYPGGPQPQGDPSTQSHASS